MVKRAQIRAFSKAVARRFHPQKIILFGSYAHGTPREDSDVDLLVVLPYQGKSGRMAAEIRRRIKAPFPLDLIVRSPQQLRQRLAMGDSFFTEVTRRGKVLYAARDR